MKRVLLVLLLACPVCRPWATLPHRAITQAALDTLPAPLRARIAADEALLIESYCMLPDRYVETEQFGFTRKGPGPRDLSELRIYCVRPDNVAVHSASWDRDDDLASLVYIFERVLTSLAEKRHDDAAKYMGTLSHFLEDSLSPPHAIGADELQAVAPPGQTAHALHNALESSVPGFSLAGRAPHSAGQGLVEAATSILDRCYAAAAENRKNLRAMVRAVPAADARTLDRNRLRAARAAAELLADSLYTLLEMAGR
jgi:hypothetical protein